MTFARLALVLAAPLLLVSCLLTPGKFESSLHIAKDRGFTFTYVGEVILVDPAQAFAQGMAEGMAAAGTKDDEQDEAAEAATEEKPTAPAEETEAQVAERKAMAEALAREVGYRSVEYLGKNVFRVDYSLTGRLDRSFVYPINVDAQALFPWVAVEVRKDGTARVKALAFGEAEDAGGLGAPGGDSVPATRDGTFTLTTDAELVMQNNEAGLAPGPDTKVVWRVTPANKTVPTAVVRFGS